MSNLMQANRQWATRPADQRFQTVSSLKQAVEHRYQISHEGAIPVEHISLAAQGDNDLGVYLRGSDKPLELTHWSFGQLCNLSKAPASYLRDIPSHLAADCLNHSLKNNRETVKALVQVNGSADLKALTSETYGRIWDIDVVRFVERLLQANPSWKNPMAYAGGKFGASETVPSGLYASDRDVWMFFIDEDHKIFPKGIRGAEDKGLSRGFFIWNSEVGSASFGITTFLYNYVCNNHIVWGASDVKELRIRHTFNAPGRMISEAVPQLQKYIEMSTAAEEKQIEKALDYRITTATAIDEQKDDVVDFLSRRGFTRAAAKEAFQFAMDEEGDATRLWNVVQGVTAAAREKVHIDARVGMERAAGKLMEMVA